MGLDSSLGPGARGWTSRLPRPPISTQLFGFCLQIGHRPVGQMGFRMGTRTGKGETGRLMCGVRGGKGLLQLDWKKVGLYTWWDGATLGEGFKEWSLGRVFIPRWPRRP